MINLAQRRLAALGEQYNNELERHRAQRLLLVDLALIAYSIFLIVPWLLQPAIEGRPFYVLDILQIIGLLFVGVMAQRQIVTGNLNQAVPLVIALVTYLVFEPRLENLHGTDTLLVLLPLIVAAVFGNRKTLLITAAVLVILLLYVAVVQNFSEDSVVISYAQSMPGDLSILLLGLGLLLLLLLMQGNLSERLANADIKRDQRIRLIHNLRAELDRAPTADAMMVSVAELLTTQLEYTFMQLHLSDPEGRLNTHTRVGMGTRFSARRTELPAESTIRVANRSQQSIVVAHHSVYEARSHLLPSVTYGIAVPLMAQGEALGVLDIQSSAHENPFTKREITILELIANDLGRSLIRLREQQDARAMIAERDDINRTLEQQVNRLRHEIDQSLGSEWLSYLEGRGQAAIGFDMVGKEQALLSAADVPEHLRAVMSRGEMIIEQKAKEQVVTLPIQQRDEVLGAISFALPKDARLSERQLEMASQVINRLATALDNARLVEQTQAQVRRERKTSEVANMLLGQQEVNALLDTAAESFNEALGAIYTRIQIDPDMLLTAAPVEEA